MRILADYNLISRIFSIFNSNTYTEGDNITSFLNELKYMDMSKYSAKIFERIIKILNEPWIFYQFEYFYIIHSLLNEPIFCHDVYFQPIAKIFNEILKHFFSAVNKNKMIPIESLFRIPTFLIKDSILNNYDEIQPETENYSNNNKHRAIEGHDGNYIPEDEEVEYDGNNIEMVKIIEETTDNKKKKDKKKESEEEKLTDNIIWTENEDLLLIQNYSEFSEYDNFYQMLDQLFPLKNLKEIKARIKTLKLKKGINKAMKVFKKLHKKRKQKEEKLFNIIIELSDECRNETKKKKIEKTISSLRQQLESYKVRKGLLDNSPELECVLLPNSEEEIDVLQDIKFQQFIKNLGLIPPDEENLGDSPNKCWRVDSKSDTYEISIIIEKLENFERVINENVEIEDPEREEERRKARKDKKKKKKKHKKDKKEKKKKKKKRDEYKESSQDEKQEDDDADNYEDRSYEREEPKSKKSFRTRTAANQSVEPSVISNKKSESRNEFYNKSHLINSATKKSSMKSHVSNVDNLTVKNSVAYSSSSKKTNKNFNNYEHIQKNENFDYGLDQDDEGYTIPKTSKKKKLRKGLREDDYNFD